MITETSISRIQQLFELQKSHQWVVRNSTAEERKAKLRKLKDVVQKYLPEVVEAVIEDVQKPRFEVFSEVSSIPGVIDKTIAELEEWMKPRNVPVSMNPQSKAKVFYEPKGVCLIFGPWNYPFTLVIQPLVEAIAAGNCCILKPSDLTPAVSEVTAKVIESVFDEEEVAVVHGDVDVANALLDFPFNHIFFTGSTNVGKIVMAAAAKHLASVTLELGGKSPVIIDEGVDLKRVAERIGWGKGFNCGQTCLAPDYGFILESQKNAFIEYMRSFIETAYRNENDEFNQEDLAQIVNEKNFNRVKRLFEDAINKGAIVELGGTFDEGSRKIEPTILSNVSDNMLIMQEEIFAPIFPIMTYEKLQDVVEYLQDKDKPLALYFFSNKEDNIDYILANTSSGGVCINDVMVHNAEQNLPFGGANTSGLGSYHGFAGFKEFSHEKSVLFNTPTEYEKMAYPPYRGKLEMLMRNQK